MQGSPSWAARYSVWLLVNLTLAFYFLAGPSRPRRKGITKEDREMARLLHRTHLLCLLSRGLLYDEAANDPLLQVSPKPACALVVYMTECAADAVRHIGYVSHTHTHTHLCETCVKACMMSYMCVVYTLCCIVEHGASLAWSKFDTAICELDLVSLQQKYPSTA